MDQTWSFCPTEQIFKVIQITKKYVDLYGISRREAASRATQASAAADLASMRATKAARAGVMPGRFSSTGMGSSKRICNEHGGDVVSHKGALTGQAFVEDASQGKQIGCRSEIAASTRLLRAMYSGVPMTIPVLVIACEAATRRAIPKSRILLARHLRRPRTGSMV